MFAHIRIILIWRERRTNALNRAKTQAERESRETYERAAALATAEVEMNEALLAAAR